VVVRRASRKQLNYFLFADASPGVVLAVGSKLSNDCLTLSTGCGRGRRCRLQALVKKWHVSDVREMYSDCRPSTPCL
jgi:hypothetical protein